MIIFLLEIENVDAVLLQMIKIIAQEVEKEDEVGAEVEVIVEAEDGIEREIEIGEEIIAEDEEAGEIVHEATAPLIPIHIQNLLEEEEDGEDEVILKKIIEKK